MCKLGHPLALLGLTACMLLGVIVADPANAKDRLELGLNWADDGSCSEATESLALTYLHESDAIDKVYARILQKPSGGNCLVENTTGTLEVEKRFPLAKRGTIEWQGVAKFLADVRSFSAPYNRVGGSLRPDGAPYTYVLPAGQLDTWSGVLGAGAEIAGFDLALGFNVEPVCFSDGSCERTLHVAVGTEFNVLGGALEVAVDLDTDGSNRFGSARTVWRQNIENTVLGLTVGVYHDYGLRAIMPDAPATIMHNGDEYALEGPGVDSATRLGIDLAFKI